MVLQQAIREAKLSFKMLFIEHGVRGISLNSWSLRSDNLMCLIFTIWQRSSEHVGLSECALPAAFQMVLERIRETVFVLLAPFSALLSEQNVHNLFEQSFLSLYFTLTWKPFCVIKVTENLYTARNSLIFREQHFFHYFWVLMSAMC